MKINKFFLILWITVFGLFGRTQAQVYDSTYRPKRFKEQLAKFNAEPITKNEYVFLGNSITAGTDWSRLLILPQARNRGIPGDITFGVLERLQEVIDRKPAKVFILIGINDISRNIPDSVILRNHKKIIERIREGSKKTQIYVYTLLPVNASFEKYKKTHFGKDEHILFINNEIRKYVAKKVSVIDLYPHFLDENNMMRKELTTDGLHLNSEGYKVWADILHNGGYLK